MAIFSNLAFITYGSIEWLPPVLFLHMVLPLNIVRLAEIVRAPQATSDLTQAWRQCAQPSQSDETCPRMSLGRRSPRTH